MKITTLQSLISRTSSAISRQEFYINISKRSIAFYKAKKVDAKGRQDLETVEFFTSVLTRLYKGMDENRKEIKKLADIQKDLKSELKTAINFNKALAKAVARLTRLALSGGEDDAKG